MNIGFVEEYDPNSLGTWEDICLELFFFDFFARLNAGGKHISLINGL
jgi:hypothetical protein